MVVLVCHTLAMAPGLGGVFVHREVRLTPGDYALIFTPLHVFWNGAAAVFVFFVLSGFVLTLPFCNGAAGASPRAARTWLAYYPKRVLRLGLPVWGSVAVASALMELVPRRRSPALSTWANLYQHGLTARSVLQDMSVVLHASTANAVLWSLKWEMLFSLLLPAYLVFAMSWRRGRWPKLLALMALQAYGEVTGSRALLYLPVFGISAVLAVEREHVAALTGRLSSRAWALLGVSAWLLLDAVWSARTPLPLANSFVTVGAALTVVVFLGCPAAVRAGDGRVCQWWGRLSFSLYLVHLPVLLAVTRLAGRVPLALVLVLGLVAAVAVAVVFSRLVEQPAHAVSTAVGRLAAATRLGTSGRESVRHRVEPKPVGR